MEEDLLTSRDLVDVDLGAVAWGDYDKDGKLDIFITGRTASNPPSQTFSVFRNIDSVQNTRPVAPELVNAKVFGPTVSLRWNAPQGVPFDRVNGLTYNLYVTPQGSSEATISPLAALPGAGADGGRRMVYYGNVGHSTSWTIASLPNGEYSWAVQTIDPDFEGSLFSEVGTFSFTNPVPEITSVSVPDLYPDNTEKVTASIEIQVDTVVADVIVVFRGIGADSTGWDSVSLGNTGLAYSFDVNLDRVDEMGLQYLFKVKGRFGFDAVTDTLHTYRYYAEGLSYTNLKVGEEVTAYNIVSIPLELDEDRIVEVIEPAFGTYDIFEWRMFHYTDGGNTEFKSNLTRLETPKGYWIITKESRTFNSGPGRVVEANSHKPYQIALSTGWNQISDPLPYDVYWSDVQEANNDDFGTIVTQLIQFNGAFQAADRVEFQQGAFVFATEPYTLRIPVTKNPAVGRRGRLLPPEPEGGLDENRWLLPVFAAQGRQKYELGAIGMRLDASEGIDQFDGRRAPRIADYMDMTIGKHEEALSRDVVPSAEGHIWDVTVRAHQKGLPVTLSWDHEWVRGNRNKLVLFDVDRQLIIPMDERSSYDAWGDETSRRFRIYMGSSAYIQRHLQPDWVHLGLAYPNPAQGPVHIPFSLPPQATPYEVQVDILTLDGKLVHSLVHEQFKPGFHTLDWDGTDINGSSIAAGMYVYRLRVWGDENYWQETRKLMLE
ncbi:MAG: FlgD immunoglobulin-like domain containing protein [Bacteroidota bacterium]